MAEHLFAELTTPEALVRAIQALKRLGIRRIDAYTPHPIRNVEMALDPRRSRLGRVVLAAALAGAAAAFLLQWYLNAVDYPIDVGGRPANAWPSFVPISFEMGVLAAALTAFFGSLRRSRLRLHHPSDYVPGFTRASVDGYWVGVDAEDPMLHRSEATRVLEDLGATEIAWVGAGGRTA